MSYAVHHDPKAVQQALDLCRGSYQRAIILGREAISGATLRGTAKSYGDRYKRSAGAILARCRAAGIPVYEMTGDHNRREIHVGYPRADGTPHPEA